jgi:hypothetical protein
MKDNPTLGPGSEVNSEKKKVTGQIDISYSVYCPHCEENLDDYYDKEWWNETMGGDFPCEADAYRSEYPATCKHCKKDFIINGFIH